LFIPARAEIRPLAINLTFCTLFLFGIETRARRAQLAVLADSTY
jgi:hypothetical protein